MLRRPWLGLPREGHRAGSPAVVEEAGGGVRGGAFPRQEPGEELAILLDLEGGLLMVPRVRATIHRFLVFLFEGEEEALLLSSLGVALRLSCKI